MIHTLWVVVLAAALGTSVDARAGDRFVARGTDAGNDCASALAPCRTIGHAVAQAAAFDVIKLAKGTYREELVFGSSTTLTVEGGWSSTFTTRDPIRNKTRVTGMLALDATAGQTIDITLDGLTISGYPAAVRVGTSGAAAVHLVVQGTALERSRSGLEVWGGGTGTVNVELIDSLVFKNRGDWGGLVLFASDDSTAMLRVVRSEFRSNEGTFWARTNGGTSTVNVEILDSIVHSNRGGVRIGAEDTFGSVQNSVIANNRGGGGLSVGVDGVVEVVNTTITANRTLSTDDPGAGVRVFVRGEVSFTNSIVWGNRMKNTPDDVRISAPNGGTISAAFSDIGTMTNLGGTFVDDGGNISADPLLRGTPPRPLPGSPVLDVGTCTGVPATDIDGDPRPSGAGCDMGADEVAP